MTDSPPVSQNAPADWPTDLDETVEMPLVLIPVPDAVRFWNDATVCLPMLNLPEQVAYDEALEFYTAAFDLNAAVQRAREAIRRASGLVAFEKRSQCSLTPEVRAMLRSKVDALSPSDPMYQILSDLAGSTPDDAVPGQQVPIVAVAS